MARVWKQFKNDESGYILVMSLFVLVILFIIGTTLAIMGIQEFTLSARTKLMDQAYSIADAGVNRAAVALQMNPSLTATTSPGPYPTVQSGPYTESFGGGSYTWNVYQSNTVPTDASYKVIRSTGTITKAGRTAERTIETRIIAGTGGTEYDASFDYCIYVGNSDYTAAQPAQVPPNWPTQRLWGTLAGTYTYDGYTPYGGRSPRGAIYVKGGIDVPVYLTGGIIFKGNLVATDDINLRNAWAANWNTPGITIDNNGKVIAGIDPTHGGNGDVNVDLSAAMNVTNSVIRINGQLIAGRDCNISTSWTASFTDPTLTIAGIKTGRDMNFQGEVNIVSRSLQLGPIISGRKVTINSNWGNGVTANNIWAGQNDSGDGVYLNTRWASTINTGAIISRGRVYANATAAWIKMGDVTAGNSNTTDYGGTGIYFNMGFASCNAGNLTSQGLIDLNASIISGISVGTIYAGTDNAGGSGGTGVQFRGSALSSVSCSTITSVGTVVDNASSGSSWSSSWIWSGNNVNLNSGELWIADDSITTGAISACGYVNIKSGDDVTCNGNVQANAWVKLYSSDVVTSGGIYAKSLSGAVGPEGYSVFVKSYAMGGLSGNHVQTNGGIYADGPIMWYSTAESFGSDSHLTGGAWGSYVHIERALGVDAFDTTDAKIGTISGTGDSVRACGGFYSQCPGWIGDAFDNDIDISSTVRQWSGQSYDVEDTDVPSHVWDNSIALPVINSVSSPSLPGKPNPVYVDKNGQLNEPGPAGQAKNVDVLYEASLTAPVNLLEPNWTYFEQQATADDSANPSAPHMIYDGGPGDSDGLVNGHIRFVWDTSKAYSTRETIYNGSSGVSLDIQALNWSTHGAKFEATIVSKGDVTITAPNTDWFMNTQQVLNVVSGHDISSSTGGLTIWESADCHYHFWADHDIKMDNLRFSFGGSQTYYGSFTAGNRVTISDNSFAPNCTFRWSRWALDPVAWAPPFKVLSWKEL
jgi:hypothetical protein